MPARKTRSPTSFVAEVKSVTDTNEETRLPLGLGQVRSHARLLVHGGSAVILVLGAERQPTDLAWAKPCESRRAMLVWPDIFEQLLRLPTAS